MTYGLFGTRDVDSGGRCWENARLERGFHCVQKSTEQAKLQADGSQTLILSICKNSAWTTYSGYEFYSLHFFFWMVKIAYLFFLVILWWFPEQQKDVLQITDKLQRYFQ